MRADLQILDFPIQEGVGIGSGDGDDIGVLGSAVDHIGRVVGLSGFEIELKNTGAPGEFPVPSPQAASQCRDQTGRRFIGKWIRMVGAAPKQGAVHIVGQGLGVTFLQT